MSAPSLFHYLSIIPDFRQSWKAQHQLSDILFPVVCAVIFGSKGWDEIEDFGYSKLNFLRQYGNFTGGIPSHDTLARVMALINSDQLQTAFAEWMKACCDVTGSKSLKLLNLQGCLVTIDAMGCQKKIAASVLHKGADYLLSVKDNQPKLVKAFEQAFPVSELAHFEGDAYVTDEKNRGRQETRYHIVKEFTE